MKGAAHNLKHATNVMEVGTIMATIATLTDIILWNSLMWKNEGGEVTIITGGKGGGHGVELEHTSTM